MSATLIATFAGLITLLGWGVSDWLTAKSSKVLSELETNLALELPGALLMIVIMAVSHKAWPSAAVIGQIFLVGILFTAAYLLLIKALSSGLVGVVVPLANTYPLVTLLLSLIFVGAVFSGLQLIAMCAIIVGAILLAYEKNSSKQSLAVMHKETILAVGCALVWGIAFFVLNRLVHQTPWQMLLGLVSIFMALIAIILLILANRRRPSVAFKKVLRNQDGLLAGTALTLGSVAFYKGAEAAGSVLVIVVIASAAPLVTSFLGAIFDKEKIGAVKRLGAVVVVVGIIVLNLT